MALFRKYLKKPKQPQFFKKGDPTSKIDYR